MRFDFDSDSDKTGWLFSLNYIDVVQSTPTSVDDSAAPGVLRQFQNQPNPFNARTTIEYVVPSDGQVKMTVFDARGRQVRVLVDEWLPSGKHTAIWDGRDQDGHLLASGVYFHRLEAAGATRTGKMVLAK
jgi:hypothetical protein